MGDLKIREWANANEPSDDMIYKKSFFNWISFIECSIIPMIIEEYIGTLDYDDAVSVMNNHHDIIGTHTSKSIKLPVIEVKYRGATIVFRYNFYDTEVTVISYKDIDLSEFDDMYESKQGTTFYHQGIPDKYKIDTTYDIDKHKFTLRVCGYYNFYTIMALVRNSLKRSIFTTKKGEAKDG